MNFGWNAPGGGEQSSPVEMRFIDMFMTALGSLVFIALALVVLLPKASEVVISGTVAEKGPDTLTIDTDKGKKRIAFGADTKFRNYVPGQEIAGAGQPVDISGRNNLRGTFKASLINSPLDARTAEKLRTIYSSGRIISAGDRRLVVQTKDRTYVLRTDTETRYIRALSASVGRFTPGSNVTFAGRLDDDQSVSTAMLQSDPEPDPIPALERRIGELVAENRSLRDENAELRRRLAELEEELRKRKTEDAEIVRRWFGVHLIVRNCAASDIHFYVRNEGSLVRRTDNNPLPPAVEFKALKIAARQTNLEKTEVYGDQYSFISAGLAGHDLLVFNTVARVQLTYSVYVGLIGAQQGAERTCFVRPIYVSQPSRSVIGDEIELNRNQPYAWLRQLEIKTDGSNDFLREPADNSEFKVKLERFSNEQSRELCTNAGYCGTVDAHWKLLNKAFLEEDNFDIVGNDLGPSQPAANLEQCRQMCRSNRQCQAFTFNKWKSACFLKGAATEIRTDPRATSGWLRTSPPRRLPEIAELRRYTGKAFEPSGSEILGPPVRTDIPTCFTRCETNRACLAVNYFLNSQMCQLLSGAQREAVSNPAVLSGVKLPR